MDASGRQAEPMFLYNLTLQRATAITQAVFANFSAPKAQEIMVSRGKILELLRPDDDTGKVQSILAWECFGVIRSMVPFRLPGGSTDYLIVGSDSGRVDILEYEAKKNQFKKVHEETYGKSGVRRIVPGEFMAVDPNGRACMVAALERQKFVYILSRDTASNLTISSPLEAHKSHTLVLDLVAVDVGFDNPLFACLELDYEEIEDEDGEPLEHPNKYLTFYELDLGLNHVTRKYTTLVDPTANKLLAVPGGSGSGSDEARSGPGGVLVCSENYISYYNMEHKEVRSPIPLRYGAEDRGVLLISAATHKQKNLFFFLVQSEFGDIYKVTLPHEGETVGDVIIKYFDTVPPAVSLCVLKTGFLFTASEHGNHYFFQFQGIGDQDETAVASARLTDAGSMVYFQPRKITNLLLIDEIESLAPIMDMKVMDLVKENTPQIYTLCGKGARSSLRVLRHGLAVTEVATSELPGHASSVWAVKKNVSDAYHQYIVVSFPNATIVLAIDGERVVEVTDSQLLTDTTTISVSTLGDGSMLQIHPNGIGHITKSGGVLKWACPRGKTIVQAAVNERQVVIALTGGKLIYFELGGDSKDRTLLQVRDEDLGMEVTCLAIGPVPPGRQRSLFLAVGTHDASTNSDTIRIFSLDERSPLDTSSVQAVKSPTCSLALVSMSGASRTDVRSNLYLYVGLQNGVLMRSRLDESNGSLTDTRRRFLGATPVKLHELTIQGQPAVIALSSRAWLSYTYQNRFHMTPLSYDVLEWASYLSSESCTEGIVCIAGNTLRIVTLERLGQLFNQTVVPLRYTPRKMVVHPESNQLIIIEADQNTYPLEIRRVMQEDLKAALSMEDDEDEEKKQKEEDDEEEDEAESEAFMGTLEAGEGKWASCVRVLDPTTGESTSILELDDNKAAFCCTCLQFEKSEDWYLAVGVTQDLIYSPRSYSACYIMIYKFINDNTALEFLHKTEVPDVCLAVHAFRGRLLAGVGNKIRLYSLGKRKLLRKAEIKDPFPTTVVSVSSLGDRVYVGDQAESFFFVHYDKTTKAFTPFADTAAPRFLTATCNVDYETMAAGDKFGNLLVSRLPASVSEAVTKDPTGGQLRGAYGEVIHGADHKLQDIVQYHVGESITSLVKTSLVPTGAEVLLYSTIMGGIGMFVPFISKEDVDFFSHLEMHLRQDNPPLLGRDHLHYRSYYFPVKDCLDGDLCEQYTSMDPKKQERIAAELVSTPMAVSKKLEEIRNRVL